MLTLLQAMPGDYSLIFCLFYLIEQRLVNANISEVMVAEYEQTRIFREICHRPSWHGQHEMGWPERQQCGLGSAVWKWSIFVCAAIYVLYLRKIPAALEDHALDFENRNLEKENRGKEIIRLFSHLWSLLLILVLILVCGMQVVTAVLISILLSLVVYRVTAAEFRQFLGGCF